MRILLVLLPAMLLAQDASLPRVIAVNLDTVIHPITVEIVGHAIDRARGEKAELVLMRLNTPGGLMEASREVVELMLASPVPVITLVRPSGARAASAGFFLLLAGDIAIMQEGTRTGAASPVLLGQPMEPVMRKKVESDAAAWIRSIAARHNRSPEVAEKAVLEAKSFTDAEALKEKLIDHVVASEADIWAWLDGRTIQRPGGATVTLRTKGAQVSDYQPSLRERAVTSIADPNLSFLLLVVGGLLIYLEFMNPGLIVPGVAGAILFLLALLSISVLPINGAAVALLLLAIVLFVLEAKITSHGILGTGGVVAMILGSLLLVEGPPELRIRLSTALAVSLPFAAIVIFLVSLVVRAQARPVTTGADGLLRETGVAKTDLNPSGTVLIHGELWQATASEALPKGTRVRVTAVEGLHLDVVAASSGERKD